MPTLYQQILGLAQGLVRVIGTFILTIIESLLIEQSLPNYKSSRLSKLLADLQKTRSQIKEHEPVDLTIVQVELEKLFHKNQLNERIKQEFLNSSIDFRAAFNEINLDQKFGFDLLVQMVLHKRVNVSTLTGLLRKNFKGDCNKTIDAIYNAANNGLVLWDDTLEIFIVRFNIGDDVQAEIDLYQYPMPMLVEPLELKGNRDTGYYTHKDSVILRNNHHEDDVCLDYLNKINKVKLRVNTDTVAFLKNNWKNLDKPKPHEERKDFQKRQKAFMKYDRTSRDVLAHLEVTGGEFYLTHKYDKRGRVYCQGYHVTYQGNDWSKACIEFAKGELCE